ncbi:MAG: alanine racemase, partial [Spirochaetaceae bacterium]|nr:alanine racemase [Spirochaetaceae bacterium]
HFRESITSPLEILLQVNTSGESSKSGFHNLESLSDAAAQIAQMPYLKLRGLMTMAPFVDDETVVRNCFSLCREWSESLKASIEGVPVLSMGMSSDYKWAVAEGSTMLRIGTTLFGGRE